MVVGLFRKHKFVVSQLKHLTPKTIIQSRDFQMQYIPFFSPSKLKKILGNLFINTTVKMFNVSVNFKIQEGTQHFGKHIRRFNLFLMNFMSFINYRKSKTIFKSSLNSHVYWDTLFDMNIIFQTWMIDLREFIV